MWPEEYLRLQNMIRSPSKIAKCISKTLPENLQHLTLSKGNASPPTSWGGTRLLQRILDRGVSRRFSNLNPIWGLRKRKLIPFLRPKHEKWHPIQRKRLLIAWKGKLYSLTLDVWTTVILIMWRFHTPVLDNTILLPYLRTTPGTQKR